MSQAKKFPFVAKLLIVVAVLGGVGFLWWQSSRAEVLVVPVERGRAVNAVPGSVTVNAEYFMNLRAPVGGRVAKGFLERGTPVKAGDFLVQVDTGDLALEIQSIENSLVASRKRVEVGSLVQLELENAQADLENFERLAKMGNYPEMELQRSRRNVRAIEQRLALERVNNDAAIAVLENNLAVKKLQMEKMTVNAPFAGTIAEVYARPGDIISSESPIALLISASRIIEAKISEENFAGIRPGQRASVRFLGYGDQLYSATVKRVLPTADAATQRYVVYLDVDIAADMLVPGLTGEVSVVVGERDNSLLIPRRALFGGKVYVAKNGRVELRQVRTGFVSLNVVEILSGVEEGEQVLVEQLDMVRAGDRVRAVTERS